MKLKMQEMNIPVKIKNQFCHSDEFQIITISVSPRHECTILQLIHVEFVCILKMGIYDKDIDVEICYKMQ